MKSATLAQEKKQRVTSSASIDLLDDGAIVITECDTSSGGDDELEERFGGQREHIVTIPAEAVPALAFALIRKHYAGNLGAGYAITALCREEGIKASAMFWP